MDRGRSGGVEIDTLLLSGTFVAAVVVAAVVVVSDAQARQGGTLGPRRRLGGVDGVDGRRITTRAPGERMISHIIVRAWGLSFFAHPASFACRLNYMSTEIRFTVVR